MPDAIYKSVREVSSEDPVHSARNLLTQEWGKTWKTSAVGENSAYVVLELNVPQEITGIDIGNEHSAFIEVLVGKASAPADAFTDILLTCSFMTPIESKNSTNPNRVRCFHGEALVQTALLTKWQFVKIICSQPFNKHVQYGLSFIKVHVPADKKKGSTQDVAASSLKTSAGSSKSIESATHSETVKKQFGRFTMRTDSTDSEPDRSTALFSRWKASSNIVSPTAALAIRQSSTAGALRKLSDNTAKISTIERKNEKADSSSEKKNCLDRPVLDRNRQRLLFGDDDDFEEGPKEKRLVKQIEEEQSILRLKNEQINKLKNRTEKEKPARKSPSQNRHDANSDHGKRMPNKEQVGKRSLSPNNSKLTNKTKQVKVAAAVQYRPFKELLRGVVFVISGIANPDRAELRKKATAMGAIYRSDWSNGCTHLICAFQNTPKYKQVKGKGKIVTRSWIEKCFDLRKYIPWRRFALANDDLVQIESDEEILDTVLQIKASDVKSPAQNIEEKNENSEDMTLAMYDLSQGATAAEHEKHSNSRNNTSDSDTEDEINRVTAKAKLFRN